MAVELAVRNFLFKSRVGIDEKIHLIDLTAGYNRRGWQKTCCGKSISPHLPIGPQKRLAISKCCSCCIDRWKEQRAVFKGR